MSKILGMIFGYVKMHLHFIRQRHIEALEWIVNSIIEDQQTPPKGKKFVLTVGFSKSGKTTFVVRHNVLSQYFRLSTNTIHEYLNHTFSFLRDDNTINGSAYWERQFLTRLLRKTILERALTLGYSIVNDSNNLSRAERAERLKLAKKHGYKTYIIRVVCGEKLLMNRLIHADAERMSKGLKPAWVDLYKQVQHDRSEAVFMNEADHVITVVSPTTLPDDVVI